MGRAYIDHIDITPDNRVQVTGRLSRTGLTALLTPYVYVQPPADGIWEYDLTVTASGRIGATVLVPFSVDAAFDGGANANGVRVYQKLLTGPAEETTQLKAKKVEELTDSQNVHVRLAGAGYDAAHKNAIIDLTYSGGCVPHTFELEWDGNTLKSNPPQYNLNLVDTTPRDPCESIKSVQVRFDLNVPGMELAVPSTVEVRTPSGGPAVRFDIP